MQKSLSKIGVLTRYFTFERWFRFVNYTLLIPLETLNVDFSNPAGYISQSMSRRLRSKGSIKIWSSVVLWFAFVMVTGQLVRSLVMSYVINEDQHILVTCFGSIFNLAYVKRRYVEVCAFHITLVSLLYLLLVSSKWNYFFAFLTRYLDQTRNVFDQQKSCFNLPKEVASKLVHRSRLYFYLETFAVIAMVGDVFLTGNAILAISNPNRNNYHLFNHNPYIYYGLYSNAVSATWAAWTSCCAAFMFGMCAYFLAHMKLIQCKTETLQIQLNKMTNSIARRKHGDRQVIKGISRRHLHHHLVDVKQLIEEIHTTNRFWSLYLSITQLVCRSLICYCLYIVLLSNAIWFFKISFAWVMATIMTILFVTITAASKVFRKIRTSYHHYHRLMANAGISNALDIRIGLKIFTTIDLLSIRSIGFGFVDRQTIRNHTIINVAYQTLAIFFLVVNNTRRY